MKSSTAIDTPLGTDGSLAGYAAGLEVKEKLLTLEKTTRIAQNRAH